MRSFFSLNSRDIAIEIGAFMSELLHDATQLESFGFGDIGTSPTSPNACFSASVKAVDLLRAGSCSSSMPRLPLRLVIVVTIIFLIISL